MKKEKIIRFDDFVIDPDPERANWVYVCKKCVKKHQFDPNKLDDSVPNHVTCNIKGCKNEADYYLDLPKDIKNPVTTGILEIPLKYLTAEQTGSNENDENQRYKKLNKKPLKLYYGRPKDSNRKEDCDEPYFNWQGRRQYLKEFIRLHNNPWVNGNQHPDFIHGQNQSYPYLYIGIINNESINVYEINQKERNE